MGGVAGKGVTGQGNTAGGGAGNLNGTRTTVRAVVAADVALRISGLHHGSVKERHTNRSVGIAVEVGIEQRASIAGVAS